MPLIDFIWNYIQDTSDIVSIYYMKYSGIPYGSKMRKIVSPLSPVAIPFLSTLVWYHFLTNQLLAFSRGFHWLFRSLESFVVLDLSEKLKLLLIVIKEKKNTEMHCRFVDVTDTELTQFLEEQENPNTKRYMAYIELFRCFIQTVNPCRFARFQTTSIHFYSSSCILARLKARQNTADS